ncbi:MAG: RraA family protein [Candidatus Latescibacteria bacterium]|jgi:regulator of RNase E activity RraA|nr:RraA family protein [Candidatus Latescibacterota bacterium]
MSDPLPVEELCARYRKLYAGAICDALDSKELRNQTLNRAIKPVLPDMVVAGVAYTVKGMRVPKDDAWVPDPPVDILAGVTPRCVIVYDPGNEQECGHWGELTSNAAAYMGAQGVVVDGGVRDSTKHIEIPNWSAFGRYTSPIEAASQQRIIATGKPVLMTGSLSRYVRVNPGDVIFGDLDGVVVVPRDVAEEVLVTAEEKIEVEDRGREAIRKGTPLQEVYRTYRVG